MKAFLVCIAALALSTSGALAAAPVAAFTAHYQVVKDGSPVGEATMSLRAQGSAWKYTTRAHGTDGLASLLGLDIEETSLFRQHDGGPELLDYDYRLDSALKNRQRHVSADWEAGTVSVDDGKHHFSYATRPGLVDRHLLALSLAQKIHADHAKREISLPVAVKNRVQMQRFRIDGAGSVEVPAGRFDTIEIHRTDGGHDFSAWYAGERYAVPVKLANGKITLLLKSYSQP